jgi:hypothetical protein
MAHHLSGRSGNGQRGHCLASLALSSRTGLSLLFDRRIRPFLTEHSTDEIGETMTFYRDTDVARFVVNKLVDKKKYSELQKAFAISGDEAKVLTEQNILHHAN